VDRNIQRPKGVITRRQFLYIAGGTVTVAATGGVLAACGGGSPSPIPSAAASGGSPSPIPSAAACTDVGGKFSLFTWAGYSGVEVPAMKAWWDSGKITLNEKNVSNEQMVTFMKAPGYEGWDAFTINQGDNQYYFGQGIMSEVSVDEVPALAKMYKGVRDNPIFKIRDGVYNAVPWTMGPLGINYIKGKIDPVASYAEVLEPRFKNRVGCYDDALNMIATAACAVKLDPAVLTREQLSGPVKDWLVALRPQLKLISPSLGDQLTTLVGGDVDLQLVGLVWNILQGRQQNVDVAFVYPSEGTYGFVDCIAITPWAPNRCAAVAYANAAMTPATAAPLNASVVGLGTTDEINIKMKATNPDERGLYPDDIETDFMGKMKWNVSHGDPKGAYAPKSEWEKVWAEVKALA
jgi:spermidine/putrescine-binding protein